MTATVHPHQQVGSQHVYIPAPPVQPQPPRTFAHHQVAAPQFQAPQPQHFAPAPAQQPRTTPVDPNRKTLLAMAGVGGVLVIALLAVVLSGGIGRGGSQATASATPAAHSEVDVPGGSPDPGNGPTQPADAVALSKSVVQIAQLQGGAFNGAIGSGTILTADGLILTNYHVVDPYFLGADGLAVGITVDSRQVPEFRYTADMIAVDPELDLAVIKITATLDGSPLPTDLIPATIGDSNVLDVGDKMTFIGYPAVGGETVTVTNGLVSGFAGNMIKTDGAISGGNSGGAAFNETGELVGVPTSLGAGDDPSSFVDCRPLADTDGNGQLDGNDTCVPVGGFINSVRPVALALPLIQQAQAAPGALPWP